MGDRDVSAKLSRKSTGGSVTAQYRAPLLLEFPVLEIKRRPGETEQVITKTYYFWFFGLTAKLPYKSEDARDLEKYSLRLVLPFPEN